MSNINWGHLLFSFGGRINRAKWWLTILISIVINILVSIINLGVSDAIGLIVSLVAFIVLLWIGLAAGAKRLHDLNRSAAWLVFFYGAPLLLMIVFIAFAGLSVGATLLTNPDKIDPTQLAGIGGIAAIFGVLVLALAIWALVWFGCLRGTVGPNQYGPDPLEGRA